MYVMRETASPAEYLRAFDTLDTLIGMVEAVSLNRAKVPTGAAIVPVVIVAGFLGAGKTTLLRRLLTANHGLKIAAMVNDVAALNIDAALIAEVSDDTTALTNGCVCCSLSGGVARGLAEIVARPVQVDAVVIEGSGVSDPAGLAQVAATVTGVRLDCIVTVVDAAASLAPTAWDHLLRRQVMPASLIVLNKVDLVQAETAEGITARLSAMSPGTPILRTSHAAVPASVILDAAMRPDLPVPTGEAEPDPAFATRVLRAPTSLPRAGIEAALAEIPEAILRIKGFLDVEGEFLLLQAVGPRWSWHPAKPVPEPALVVIGRTAQSVDAFFHLRLAALGFSASLRAG